jgi:hypothetical protein
VVADDGNDNDLGDMSVQVSIGTAQGRSDIMAPRTYNKGILNDTYCADFIPDNRVVFATATASVQVGTRALRSLPLSSSGMFLSAGPPTPGIVTAPDFLPKSDTFPVKWTPFLDFGHNPVSYELFLVWLKPQSPPTPPPPTPPSNISAHNSSSTASNTTSRRRSYFSRDVGTVLPPSLKPECGECQVVVFANTSGLSYNFTGLSLVSGQNYSVAVLGYSVSRNFSVAWSVPTFVDTTSPAVTEVYRTNTTEPSVYVFYTPYADPLVLSWLPFITQFLPMRNYAVRVFSVYSDVCDPPNPDVPTEPFAALTGWIDLDLDREAVISPSILSNASRAWVAVRGCTVAGNCNTTWFGPVVVAGNESVPGVVTPTSANISPEGKLYQAQNNHVDLELHLRNTPAILGSGSCTNIRQRSENCSSWWDSSTGWFQNVDMSVVTSEGEVIQDWTSATAPGLFCVPCHSGNRTCESDRPVTVSLSGLNLPWFTAFNSSIALRCANGTCSPGGEYNPQNRTLNGTLGRFNGTVAPWPKNGDKVVPTALYIFLRVTTVADVKIISGAGPITLDATPPEATMVPAISRSSGRRDKPIPADQLKEPPGAQATAVDSKYLGGTHYNYTPAANQKYWNNSESVTVVAGAEDRESGIAGVRVCLTSVNVTELAATSVSVCDLSGVETFNRTRGDHTFTGLDLPHNTSFWLVVEMTNGAGTVAYASSPGSIVDLKSPTPPEEPVAVGFGRFAPTSTSVHIVDYTGPGSYPFTLTWGTLPYRMSIHY